MLHIGRYRLFPGTPREIIVPNTVPTLGCIEFLKMVYQGEDEAEVPTDGSFYVGLCSNNVTRADDLTDVTEPTVTNGYARQALARNPTGWPTIDAVNEMGRAQSAVVTFLASGGAFSSAVSRMFLTTVGSGTSGILLSYSAAFPTSLLVSSSGAEGTVPNITAVYEPFYKG
jgi:hypothetical protein